MNILVLFYSTKNQFGHFLLTLDSLEIAYSRHTQSAYKKKCRAVLNYELKHVGWLFYSFLSTAYFLFTLFIIFLFHMLQVKLLQNVCCWLAKKHHWENPESLLSQIKDCFGRAAIASGQLLPMRYIGQLFWVRRILSLNLLCWHSVTDRI